MQLYDRIAKKIRIPLLSQNAMSEPAEEQHPCTIGQKGYSLGWFVTECPETE